MNASLKKIAGLFRSSLVALLLLQIVIVALLVSLGGGGKPPEAQLGVLDLTGWDEERDGPVKLEGQWEFYWQRQLMFADFRNGRGPQPDRYAEVPNEWNGYKVNGAKLAGSGYATYRLQIKLQAPVKELALKVLPLATAYRVYANDRLLVSNGQAGTTSADFEAYGKPQTIVFEPPGDSFALIVHVSNFDYVKGGLSRNLLLGSPDAMQAYNQGLAYKDFFLAGCLMMAVFYSIGSYALNREEKISLYFGLVCLVFLCRIPLTSSYFIYEWMPTATIQLTEWINYVTYHLDILFYALMIREFFPSLFARRVSRTLVVGTAVLMVLLAVLPLRIYSEFYLVSDVLGFAALAYPYYVIVKAAVKKLRYSWLVFFGNGLLLTLVVLDVANTELNRYEMGYFSNYGIIVFTFIYTFILARRFAQSFKETKTLSLQLLELDKLKDEFLANTSHELRTPLQGIVSISESLIDGVEGPLTERQARNLDLVVASGKRLTQLIHDILDLSRLKHGDIHLTKRHVRIEPLVDFVMAVCQQTHASKPIVWKRDIPPELPAVWADENRLVQILFNLAGNAVKFTERGEVKVSVSAKPETGTVEIDVTDTGIGIAPDRMDMIFYPFTQADASIIRSYGGAGLGLSITKQLIDLHGGRIDAVSTPGVGSRFTVSLPVASGEEEEDWQRPLYEAPPSYRPEPLGAEAAAYEVAQAGERILVVDDDPANIRSAINLLKLEGYSVTAVTNGRDALEAVRRRPDIRLVILDVMMPELSGYEVCRIIRETRSPLELPVLMVTAKHQPEDLALGFEAGANDYLVKPYDKMEFRARVKTLIELNQTMQLAVKAELAFLQAQIKPHFVFNTLGAIMSLCYSDGRKAGRLIAVFSRYLRLVFDIDHHDTTVPLGRELELIRVYTEIEQERFGEQLTFRVDIDPTLLQCPVPPLTIQPLVENAIGHGVMKKVDGGLVTLTVKREADGMKIVVQDDGVGMSAPMLERIRRSDPRVGGIGLANINKRVLGMNGIPLQIESEEGRGTTVTLLLPIAAGSGEEEETNDSGLLA
ncbi:MAG: response regulator [Paenibacillaceae bacterium]|nr:response regulator [Paenibacillaceae bacterium]